MKWGVGLVEICARRLPEDGTPVPKHVTVILNMNCVLWFFILFSTFVGRYIEYLMTFVSSQQRQHELWDRTRVLPQCQCSWG